MNELRHKDRRVIFNHPQMTTITVSDNGVCHVCSLTQAFFTIAGSGNSLKVGGYLAIRTARGNQLLNCRSEVIIRSGTVRLYLDDHFGILYIDSDSIEYDVEQSQNKQKELRSISLMNANRIHQSSSKNSFFSKF